MKRSIYLAGLTALGLIATMVTFEARQDRASLTVHEIADNLYMLANAPSVEGMGGGGNTAIFVTDGGVTLVDTKIKGYGQDILAAVRELTDKPVTTIINTHTHWDHSGSNPEFPDSVNFVAHENTRGHMASQDCDDGAGFQGGSIKNCESFTGANVTYLPKTTFSDTLTLFSGADQIDLYYFGRGHTDGDIFVVFRAARAMHSGDMFARRGLPFLDVPNSNGSAIEFGETLKRAISGISNVDTVIPGHNPVPLPWNDFVKYEGFYNDLVMKAQQGKAAGRSVDDVVSSYRVPSEYSNYAAPEDRVRATVQYLFDGQ
ncbi:MAG: MBL fold metallo-hydrolase [Acidobacteriota bacterium]|nr:MBL fold metallo-hydrolase [Acidobacteriota bacterium]